MSREKLMAALGISEGSRKSFWRIEREALGKRLVKRNYNGIYHLSDLGRSLLDKPQLLDEIIQYNIFSQVIDPIDSLPSKPAAKCTIVTENSKKIEELDARTKSHPLLRTELKQNNTRIKAALAKVVDSILEFRAIELGLIPVTTGELAERLSSLDIDTLFPQYDYAKRLLDLAKTTFYVSIGYEGKDWLRDLDLKDFEKSQEDNLKFYKSMYTQTISRERKERLTEFVRLLPENTTEQYKHVQLFEEEGQIKKYLTEYLRPYEELENIPLLIQKAFKSKFFETKRNWLYHLKVNKQNTKKFLDSVFEEHTR